MLRNKLPRILSQEVSLLPVLCKSANVSRQTRVIGICIPDSIDSMIMEKPRCFRRERSRETLLAHNDDGFGECHASQSGASHANNNICGRVKRTWIEQGTRKDYRDAAQGVIGLTSQSFDPWPGVAVPGND